VQGFQFCRQGICPGRDVARPEANNEVAGSRNLIDQGGKLLGAVEAKNLTMSMVAQASNQMVTVGALKGCLTGSIDVSHDHDVRIVEAGTKFKKEMLEA